MIVIYRNYPYTLYSFNNFHSIGRKLEKNLHKIRFRRVPLNHRPAVLGLRVMGYD